MRRRTGWTGNAIYLKEKWSEAFRDEDSFGHPLQSQPFKLRSGWSRLAFFLQILEQTHLFDWHWHMKQYFMKGCGRVADPDPDPDPHGSALI
jgi:hypothetical protein